MTDSKLRNIVDTPSNRNDIDGFHDVAHEAGRIPIGISGCATPLLLVQRICRLYSPGARQR
jgi:hypothetical protein